MKICVVRIYFEETNRMLVLGKVYFSVFVEDNVPDVTINPGYYLFEEFDGPLQVVRFGK